MGMSSTNQHILYGTVFTNPSETEVMHSLNELAVPSARLAAGHFLYCWVPSLPSSWGQSWIPQGRHHPHLAMLRGGWLDYIGTLPTQGSGSGLCILALISFPLTQMFSIISNYYFLFISHSAYSLLSADKHFLQCWGDAGRNVFDSLWWKGLSPH